MDDPKLWVAVLGVVLSSLSLGWQAATYLLTGGRVKVRLLAGAVSPLGDRQVLAPVLGMTSNAQDILVKQGLIRRVFAVEAVNTGRQPVTVTGWELEHVRGARYSLAGYGEVVGPPLPHKLEVGEPATWVVDGGDVTAFVEAAHVFDWGWTWSTVRRRLRHLGGTTLVAAVELADGRRRTSKDRV